MLNRYKIYSAREIANEGLILNTKGKKNVSFVLRLIKSGELKSLPRLKTKKGFGSYRILGRDIEEYLKTYEGK